MFWMILLALLLGFVFFKLGVYSVLLGLFDLVFKVLFFASGAFLLVWGGRWLVRRRRVQPVTVDPRR